MENYNYKTFIIKLKTIFQHHFVRPTSGKINLLLTVKLGYKDHGYNGFTFITNKIV